MSSIQGFNFDKERLDHLLEIFQSGQMSQEEALELKLMLEPMHEKASNDGDLNRARDIASILISLQGILSGRLRPPARTCKRCGKGKVYPETDNTGTWFIPPKKVCRNCEKELYGEKQ